MQYNWKYVAFAPIKIATKKAGFAARQYAAKMRCEFYACIDDAVFILFCEL
jgi:hypothetical protein